jgi:ribosome-associated protein
LDEAKQPIAGMEAGTYGSGWTVVDAYQIMTHLFTPEQRGNYALEKLWKDAQVLSVAELVAQPAVAKQTVKKKAPAKKIVAKKAVKKVAAKKTTVKSVKKVATKKKTK